ncbi:AMP-binding protein [Nocardia puris]|uniref:AMP-binding protein n=1 Tax=Nocardia puris TaxID=208602 RepID=UPI001893F9B3|nr:AMP-binding protein [Nocardia puris]MBF6211166.1 AMP-binding protein [Nocardia puris]MBF6364885.1 AMP-binding protein [Nocardia puris]MBF6458671.1 AMP-binding protein [Nocardia puris]
MRTDLIPDVQRWAAAIPAIAKSGMLAPVGPKTGARLAQAFYRYGSTPAMLLAASAIRHPHRTALIDDAGALTYARLQSTSEAIAAALYALASAPPTSVGIICRNHRGFAQAMAAGAQLGAELIFLNTELTDAQLAAILARHAPDVLIFDEEYADGVEAADYPGLRVLAWRDDPAAPSALPSLADLATRSHPAPPRVRHSVRITLLTSGTTGLAKGVPRSVDPAAIGLLCATAMSVVRLRSTDTVIAAPPFFHGFGLLALLGPLTLGATAICRRRFDAQRTLADITEHSATVLMGVPVMLRRLLAAPALDRRALRESSLRVVLTGAAPITPATVRQVIDVFGPILANGYGSTEAGLVSVAGPADLVEEPGTLGRPSLGVSVRILRPDNSIAVPGEIGSIFIRSGLVYSGYSPDATGRPATKRVVDGYVDTGDMGHLDAKGRLYLDGRSDDMIVSGGENVFPGEVENRLAEHPGVAEAVVLGTPDPEFGQVLHAFVVPEPGAGELRDDDLKSHVRERLERYKVPKRFTVVTEIPRNAGGKVLRARLQPGTAS